MTIEAAGAAASPTGVRLNINDFVRVALRLLPAGPVTVQQVLEKVDFLQPGFDSNDICNALEMLRERGDSEDQRRSLL